MHASPLLTHKGHRYHLQQSWLSTRAKRSLRDGRLRLPGAWPLAERTHLITGSQARPGLAEAWANQELTFGAVAGVVTTKGTMETPLPEFLSLTLYIYLSLIHI